MTPRDPSSIRARLGRIGAQLMTPRVLVPAVLGLLFVGFTGLGVAVGAWRNVCATCPSVAQIRTWEPEQTSKLFAADGRLVTELGMQRRTPVSLDALPAFVPQAVVSIEDQRFYEHGGFDLRGFTRAALGQVMGQYRGGGSTITQQLARNMFEDRVGTERRYTRKLRELQVAFELERAYDKDRILEAYINEIYMGRGYGFQSASRAYFGKNVTEVDVAEAALLAAILNRPGYYDPFRNPDAALNRRNLVLSRMVDAGYLEPAEAEEWKQAPLPDEDYSSSSVHGIAPYFEEWVRQILDSRFGDEVYRGGLRVFTTLDYEMQQAAVEAMNWGWQRVEGQPNFRHPLYAEFDTVQTFDAPETAYLQGMMVVLDPQTGHVKAMIGGRDFEHSKFDRVRLAQRQAGSAFKPFVYAAALATGIPASHIVEDQPVVYPQVSGEDWRPSNFDEQFRGPITLREALRRSINMVAIKLGWEEVGIETVAQTARRMGVATEIERFPSTTIGAVEVVPLQLAEAYAAFANVGTKVRPFPILRVESAEGELLWEPQPERTTVLDPLPARIMVDLLQDAANRGTGGNLRAIGRLPYEVPAAGKTGTTNDGTNTWFMGFTPNLMAGVWFGMDRPIPIVRGLPQATGGGYAAPVWGRFMRHVYYGMDDEVTDSLATAGTFDEGVLEIPEPWPMPATLTTREVDGRSGKLWSRWCSDEPPAPEDEDGPPPVMRRYTEIYVPGTEPTEMCDDSRRRMFRIPRGIRPITGRGGSGGG
ncbi:MAG: PBP1A family penicillin-binding protein [Gemmatimonadetes bacterium]|nr:PBP1A family penicillin-binding protein [Gemmatimonadota bacterium]